MMNKININNMKKTLLLLLAALTAGCIQAQIKYNVTIEGATGKTIYLVSAEDKSVLTQQAPDETGKIQLSGETKEPAVVALSGTSSLRAAMAYFILDDVPATLTLNSTNGSVTVKEGSDLLKKYNHVLEIYNQSQKESQKLYMDYAKLQRQHDNKIPTDVMSRIMKRQNDIAEAEKEALKKELSKNADNLIPLAVLLKNPKQFETSFTREFLKGYRYAERPSLQAVKTLLEKEALKEPGAPVKDFVMKTPEGKDVHLTDWVGKGKYVLVDFWASWCGPCRREMPHVKAAYEQYKARGFEIVGVSFDSKHEDWLKGIAELGITWPQMSDLKGWQCLASDLYNIKSIPSTILFSPEGKVVATDLRGDQIAKKLEELLK